MYWSSLQSDQLYTWSDEGLPTIHNRAAKETRRPPAAVAPAPRYSSWLAHRTIQTVRQTGMQMRRWPRSWAQVLSLGQLPGITSTNGLHPAGTARANDGVPGQLSSSPRDHGGDLRDQPRITTSARGALEALCAQYRSRRPHCDRCEIGRRPPRQYARSLARSVSRGFACRGGDR
jgi:hypothetical protein